MKGLLERILTIALCVYLIGVIILVASGTLFTAYWIAQQMFT